MCSIPPLLIYKVFNVTSFIQTFTFYPLLSRKNLSCISEGFKGRRFGVWFLAFAARISRCPAPTAGPQPRQEADPSLPLKVLDT